MLDILVCPFDKESALELFEVKTSAFETNDNDDENGIRNPKLSSIKTKELADFKDQNQIPDNNSSFKTNLAKEYEKDNNNDNNKDDFILKDRLNNDIIIEEGILFCNNCSRFYPIVEEIPIILPDELRDKKKDIEMLNKWSEYLPDKIIKKGLPWHL